MIKILIFSTGDNEACALDCWDDDLNFVDEFGFDIADWPVDFGVYERSKGLYIWEGTCIEDEWNGTLRTLTHAEALGVSQGDNILET